MKTTSLTLATLLLSSTTALACPHDHDRFICPGDPVADASGYLATVVGVNIAQQEAAIQYNSGSNTVAPISSLALGMGCIGSICVKDSVADASGYAATIVGLNPYNFTAAIQYNSGSYTVVSLKDLEYGFGCIDNYCVGDKVMDSSGYKATITALSYLKRQVAIQYDSGSSTVAALESLALGQGCVKGNCVSDLGTDGSGYKGTVIGVNPYNNTLAFQYDSGSTTILSPASFMSSEYCSTYGDSDREAAIYFRVHGDRTARKFFYDSSSGNAFPFSMNRQ